MKTTRKARESFRFFLILWNIVQNQRTPGVHLRLSTWLEKSWTTGERRLLLLAFRSCGKSTLIGLFCAWLLWRNPDLRILVLAADLALARKMVRNVKRIIERHPLTRHLRPAQADQWGSEKFTIRRNRELRDPSMLAKGISTNITGTRADIIICDDVEVPKTSDSAEKRELLRERLLELDYILVPDGLQLYAGTPHHWFTIYADAPRRELGEEREFLSGFKRLVVPIVGVDGRSVWPERFPLEKIEAIRTQTGPNHFASQMLCQPVNLADGHLDAGNLVPYTAELEYSEAGKAPVLTLDGKRMVSVSAWWDPAFGRAGGDKSILAIVFCDGSGHYWLHRLVQIRVEPRAAEDEATQQCRQVAELIRRYYLPSVALETNGLGKFLPGLLRNEIGKAGVICSVREIVSRRPKSTRIQEAFDAVLAARALHVHRAVLDGPFIREMQNWQPEKSNQQDDALDAVAGALSLEPVRLPRQTGTQRQTWMGNVSPGQAKSDFDV